MSTRTCMRRWSTITAMFMTNTINTIIGQNVRFTLIKSIHACATATELRNVYPAWLEAISGNRIGLKRLPELRDKLFQVL